MPPNSFKPTPNVNPKDAFNAGKITKLLQKDPIVETARSYVEADIHVKQGDVAYKLAQQEGAFARVLVAATEGGGYALVLKKVYELWVVVAAGQDLPSKETGEKYGLPTGWYSTEY